MFGVKMNNQQYLEVMRIAKTAAVTKSNIKMMRNALGWVDYENTDYDYIVNSIANYETKLNVPNDGGSDE